MRFAKALVPQESDRERLEWFVEVLPYSLVWHGVWRMIPRHLIRRFHIHSLVAPQHVGCGDLRRNRIEAFGNIKNVGGLAVSTAEKDIYAGNSLAALKLGMPPQ